MSKLRIIIPSKTWSNAAACISAVRSREPEVGITLVSDGLSKTFTDSITQSGVDVIEGVKPFIFARNVNLGILFGADDGDDVVVLNDDALLVTPQGFTVLQTEAVLHPEFGLIASTTNVTCNPSQVPKGCGLREEPRMVPFIAVLIPHRTIKKVGLMDERFGGITTDGRVIYGFCDNDYCRRVRNAGLKIGIHDDCFVDHASLPSSFRGAPNQSHDISLAAGIYFDKWGDLE